MPNNQLDDLDFWVTGPPKPKVFEDLHWIADKVALSSQFPTFPAYERQDSFSAPLLQLPAFLMDADTSDTKETPPPSQVVQDEPMAVDQLSDIAALWPSTVESSQPPAKEEFMMLTLPPVPVPDEPNNSATLHNLFEPIGFDGDAKENVFPQQQQQHPHQHQQFFDVPAVLDCDMRSTSDSSNGAPLKPQHNNSAAAAARIRKPRQSAKRRKAPPFEPPLPPNPTTDARKDFSRRRPRVHGRFVAVRYWTDPGTGMQTILAADDNVPLPQPVCEAPTWANDWPVV